MHSAGQKIKDVARGAKEHVHDYEAKVEEKAENATARTAEEKEIAHERRKVKEAQAKMDLHQSKARHADEKLTAEQTHAYGHLHQPVGTVNPVPGTGTALPTYPLGGHRPGHQYK